MTTTISTCIDPDDTVHEHCPNHGCVEYVCCMPKPVNMSKCSCDSLVGVPWCPYCIGVMTRLAQSMWPSGGRVEFNPFPAPEMIGQPTTPLVAVYIPRQDNPIVPISKPVSLSKCTSIVSDWCSYCTGVAERMELQEASQRVELNHYSEGFMWGHPVPTTALISVCD